MSATLSKKYLSRLCMNSQVAGDQLNKLQRTGKELLLLSSSDSRGAHRFTTIAEGPIRVLAHACSCPGDCMNHQTPRTLPIKGITPAYAKERDGQTLKIKAALYIKKKKKN